MARIPDALAREIKEWGRKNIPQADVYNEEDNKGRETQIHFTVKYGLHTTSLQVIKEFTKDFKPFDVVLGEISRFTPPKEDYDVVKIEVDGKELRELNKAISVLPNSDSHPVYKPHVTIGYINKGACNELSGQKYFKGKKGHISQLIWSSSTGTKTTFDL